MVSNLLSLVVEDAEDTIEQKIRFLMFLRNCRLRNKKVFEAITHVEALALIKPEVLNKLKN